MGRVTVSVASAPTVITTVQAAGSCSTEEAITTPETWVSSFWLMPEPVGRP